MFSVYSIYLCLIFKIKTVFEAKGFTNLDLQNHASKVVPARLEHNGEKMNSKKTSRIAKTTIIASALVAGGAYCANGQNREYARMEPMAESRMEIVSPATKDFFAQGISMEDISHASKGTELPSPSVSTATAQGQNGEEQKYSLRELKVKETLRHGNFAITLLYTSYSFKEISATFAIYAGEEEWKMKAYPKREQRIDYVDFDNERAFRLNFLLDEIKAPGNLVVLKLLEQRIAREEANKNKE